MRRAPTLLLATLALCACAQSPSAQGTTQGLGPSLSTAETAPAPDALRPAARGALLGNGKVQHVVIIFQENRTTDNLFNGLPGADTAKSGYNSAGAQVTLQSLSMTSRVDVDHSHASFNTAFDGGRMDGFNLERSDCHAGQRKCPPKDVRAYSYVPKSEVQPYFTMAEQYAFGDKMFSTQAGPSFPAHQYILSGTSTTSKGSSLRASDNALDAKQKFTGGCDSPVGSLVKVIDANGSEDQQVFPCFDRPSLTDLVNAKHLTWRYYLASVSPGLWNGPDAIKHVRDGSQYSADVVAPPSRVLTDIKNGTLANVVWVTPTLAASDHPGQTNGTGPAWVASVVNAIGKSNYWNSTVIFVTWDDWGGFYDHVAPKQYNSYELGFRVPLIAIGPYVKPGYVSHVQHEFGSILKFTEKAFGLGSLNTTDVRADDISDCFSFSASPRAFKTIASPHGAEYFLRLPISTDPPDNQ
jgi:phospholipase C